MDPSKFTDAKTGRLVSIEHPRYQFAFIPDPAPDWTIPESLVDLCMEAWDALGAMNGSLNNLPNPELLLRPLQEREAQQSSKLEGTDADPADLILFAQNPRDPKSESDPANALKEVHNYSDALHAGYHWLLERPFSLGTIREMHRRLLDGVRGEDKVPGQFRNDLVAIGRPAKFIPPPAVFLNDLLEDLQRYINKPYTTKRERLIRAFIAHYQFEAIHPFFDGNGRIGRVILSLMIYSACGHTMPWLYLSPYFERNKDDYTSKLFRVSANGEWPEWIEFCMHGVIEQAKDAIKRCKLLQKIREQYVEASKPYATSRTVYIIDSFFSTPLVLASTIEKRFGVSYNTARADIDVLTKVGILKKLKGASRPSAFYAWEFFRVTYYDNPRLATPEEIADAISSGSKPPPLQPRLEPPTQASLPMADHPSNRPDDHSPEVHRKDMIESSTRASKEVGAGRLTRSDEAADGGVSGGAGVRG